MNEEIVVEILTGKGATQVYRELSDRAKWELVQRILENSLSYPVHRHEANYNSVCNLGVSYYGGLFEYRTWGEFTLYD